MSGYNKYKVPINGTRTLHLQSILTGKVDACKFRINNEVIDSVVWDSIDDSYIVTTLQNKEDNVYNSVNGDVYEATKTGDVFLYLSGMYYNLSSGIAEMRGRKTIKRSDGPLIKLANISNSGDMFKEAHKEVMTTAHQIPF